jgi:hypothetical protein
VRVAVTTDHRTVSTGPQGLPDGAEYWTGRWTPHDIDQWVRRSGFEVGREELYLAETGHPERRATRTYAQVAELAEAMVRDLERRLLTSDSADSLVTDDAPAINDSVSSVNDLHANVHVLIVASRVREHSADGSEEEVTDPKRLPGLLGCQALLLPQRNRPVTLEEWIRHDPSPPEDILDGIGLPDDLLAVSGDVTLLCTLGSPSWALVEVQQLVEFGVSMVGPLAAWSVWLRLESQRAGGQIAKAAETDTLDDVFLESARVAEQIGRVRALVDYLRSAQLMRGHRDRQLLRRFIEAAGVDHLEESLHTSVESVLAQREFGTAHAERIVEKRRKSDEERRKLLETRQAKAMGFLDGVLALVAIAGLTQLFQWLSDHLGWDTRHVIGMELAVLAVLVLGAAMFLFVWLPRVGKPGGGPRRDG